METALITIMLLLSASIIIYIIYRNISRNYYGLCPKCHKEFKVSIKRLVFTTHACDEFNLTCPYCGFHGMIQFKKIN